MVFRGRTAVADTGHAGARERLALRGSRGIMAGRGNGRAGHREDQATRS
jgi:hypothetical protein